MSCLTNHLSFMTSLVAHQNNADVCCIASLSAEGENVDFMRTHRAIFQLDNRCQVRIYRTSTLPNDSLHAKQIIKRI